MFLELDGCSRRTCQLTPRGGNPGGFMERRFQYETRRQDILPRAIFLAQTHNPTDLDIGPAFGIVRMAREVTQMTKLTKPVTRESACMDRGIPLIVTLHPRHLEVRPKGTRQRYTIGYDACLWIAVKRELEERRREKQSRKGRRR